jgi:hypothetical protein
MTVRMTITMPDDLKSLINNYNTRNTFNKLVVSQIARRAIIEFIRTNDPDLISEEAQVNQCKQEKQEIPQVTEDQGSAEESPDTSVDTLEFIQEVVQDFQDTEVLLTEGKEFTCERCGALFISKSPNARFCSPECMQANQGEK